MALLVDIECFAGVSLVGGIIALLPEDKETINQSGCSNSGPWRGGVWVKGGVMGRGWNTSGRQKGVAPDEGTATTEELVPADRGLGFDPGSNNGSICTEVRGEYSTIREPKLNSLDEDTKDKWIVRRSGAACFPEFSEGRLLP